MTPPMIVFCHLLNDSSGSPRVLKQSIEALGDRTSVLFVGSQGRGILETADIKKNYYWYRRSRFRLITLVTFFISQLLLYRALSRAKLPKDAVIYVNTLLPFAAAIWGKRNGRPVLCHVHEISITPSPLRKLLTTVTEKCASKILYVSHEHAKRLPLKGPPHAVVPNAVSKNIAEQASRTALKTGASKPFNVLMLASARDYKGVVEFISLARHYAADPSKKFTLVLNESEADANCYIAKHEMTDNVSVFPRTSEPESFYSQADLIVNLSRVDQWIETFGLTLIEGMAFGLPAIAPPVGGPSEIVTPGLHGFLIDSRDENALIDAIDLLASSTDSYARFSQAARERALDFSSDALAENLRHHLSELLIRKREA